MALVFTRSGVLRPQIVREHQPAPLAVSGLQANLVAAEGGAGGALPVGGGWAPTLGLPPPAEEGKETEPHCDPAPLAVADRGRPPRAARRCPQASAPPLSRGELRPTARRRSPLEPGADVAPPLEQKPEMVRTARVRRRRRRDRGWNGASRALSPRGSVHAQTLGRDAREKSRGK
jgi:hypothetical protein